MNPTKCANLSLLALLLLGIAAAPAALVGCEDDEFFRDCPLSQTIIEACQAESASTTLTCVVAEHPMCDEQVCAQWRGSDSFCTRACTQTIDCPEASTCESHLNLSLCVPDFASNPTGQ